MSDIHNQFNSATFKNTIFDYGGKKIPKALGRFPVSPNVFIGRENSTKQIHEKLSSDVNQHLLLLVNGKGGIGKTTLASQYYFEYSEYYKHLIWLVSETGIKDAIMSLALSLDIRFQDNMAQLQKIREIIRVISTLKRPVLIIIDNANSLEDLDESYQILRQFHNTHILLTSRIEKYEDIATHKVAHLDEKTANRLFKHYYKAFKEEEQELLDAVLKAIGYNTLIIELLAKNLNKFNTDLRAHYPLQKLLKDIQKKGVLAISKSKKVRSDYKLLPATPEAIISTMYDISELSEAEKQILSIFAVLPATSIPLNDLEQFLPSIEELDIVLLELSQKGWIDYDKAFQSFKTNPIISEIVRVQNKDRLEDDTLSLVNLLINMLDYELGIGHIEGDFEEIKKVVSYAETFVYNFEVLNHNKTVVFERVGNFYKTYGNLDKALQFLEAYSKLAKELSESNPTNIDFKNSLAISYSKLGAIYTTLGNLDKALQFFEDEVKLFEELSENHPSDVVFKNGLAISYLKLGVTHTALGNLNKALAFFEDEVKLFEELSENHPSHVGFKNGLAVSYEKLGETHTTLGNLEKALVLFEDEVKLFEELSESHPNNVGFKNGLAVSYSKLGETHKALGNLDKALAFFEEYLELTKELSESHPSHVGFKNGLAVSYSKLGVTHTALGNLEKALAFIETYSKLRKELSENHPSHIGFKNGLAISYEKLGETHTALLNLDKALVFFEEGVKLKKELYESHPSHVRFKNGLAISYLNLGSLYVDKLNQKEKGIPYLQKAKVIWEELTTNFPSYVEFQNNYAWIIEKLKSLEWST
ncbi:hypothetical protein IMCC3317_47520 [Kordia antarctica]|uniref:NB-ARC domain-containing protein n=1 Tax=Kordia antarctica TaxID=1218801 RepID=A0A7L4ZRW9_9FLAO|nr:tetratricopeptide repeat protein [Kordia antarctica]QHI39342.1 hypothetical protein IMCC3317_47520 [Kordia antarctica]